ncbi:MAG: hypothetical protein AB1798_13130, partial [Spirochaetota bacterium]
METAETINTAMKLHRRLFVLFIPLLSACIQISALDNPRQEVIVEEFWCELDPMVRMGDTYPLTREAALKQILEEAQFVFSGMMYGFKFQYTPSDKTRRVDEIYFVEPVSQIPWGDKGLKIL